MTGKQLNDEQRALLARMFQVKSLKNADISFILNISMKTVQRRRIEYEQTGNLRKHRDVSKNAEKLKPQHLQKLIEWHKSHPSALLEDMQQFLRVHCGLEISRSAISRQIRRADGGVPSLREGRWAKIRARKQREAEGRSLVDDVAPPPPPQPQQGQQQGRQQQQQGFYADGASPGSSRSSSNGGSSGDGGGGESGRSESGDVNPGQQRVLLAPMRELLAAQADQVPRNGGGQSHHGQTVAQQQQQQQVYRSEQFVPVVDGPPTLHQGGGHGNNSLGGPGVPSATEQTVGTTGNTR